MLGISIEDTLCGTKILWRKDSERIAANRSYFGDFDLLFGVAKLSVVYLVRWRSMRRAYGDAERWESEPMTQYVTRPDLIFDLGAHKGGDTEFYLRKGFRVVAVEANPVLAD